MYQAVNAFAKPDRITQLYPFLTNFDNAVALSKF